MDVDDAAALLGSQPVGGTPAVGGGAPPGAMVSDIERLKRSFANERLAPEVLPYEGDLVARVRDQLARQDAEIEALEAGQEAAKPARILLAADAARARYLLAAYHRARLEKVEAFAAHFVNAPGEAAALLSPAEGDHARSYWLAAGRHLKRAAAARLPPPFASLARQSAASTGPDMVATPCLDGHVVARALADRGTVELPGGDAVDVRAGDVYALAYRAARGLLADEWVALI